MRKSASTGQQLRSCLAWSFCLIGVLACPSFAQQTSAGAETHFTGTPVGTDTIADLVEQISPAVVNIVCTGTGTRAQITRIQKGDDNNRKLRRHLGLEGSAEGLSGQVVIKGSGVLVRPDGYVLTCLHVVANAEDIKVILKDGRKLDAKIVGRDGYVDLAMLKVEAAGLPVVKFGDSEKLRVGQWVFAIGNPYGYTSSVTAGLVSGLNREAEGYLQAFGARTGAVTFIQTDVPLNVGSSGGPLLNLQGEVVGINSFVHSEAQNLGFSTPSNTVKKIADDLIQKGSTPHPYLGIEMRDQSEAQGAGLVYGVEVSKVKVPSPANSAGMQVGDLIVEMDGGKVHSPADVSRIVARHALGEQISVLVKRSGADKSLSVKVESLPEDFD